MCSSMLLHFQQSVKIDGNKLNLLQNGRVVSQQQSRALRGTRASAIAWIGGHLGEHGGAESKPQHTHALIIEQHWLPCQNLS